ncbi:hypothetical protein [Mitsuaria sp. GD03876]|uniref:hypothetical protein n=1 Tax=Mitsuaria sp. GD03876 TaxID=2975399 RepID=UPI00244AC5ED|nr:hypothetical protein [Mitsuaria sp. GD03876]MDH0863219.1 hypothetical protein [Mitsuaria sp. GD03876]
MSSTARPACWPSAAWSVRCCPPADGKGECCAWCKSPLLMVDMPRLANALRKRSPSEPLLMPNGGKPVGWSCRGCGAPMDPTRETRCGQCHHAVVASSLEELGPLLDALEDDARLARERHERADSYATPHDPAGGKHGGFWKGEYERRKGRDWGESGWPQGPEGTPPTLREIALRIAAFLLR